MTRPRLIRGLQIAWSMWWGILCVLPVVLWVRSPSWVDGVGGPVFSVIYLGAGSMPGAGGFAISTDVTSKWELNSQPADEWWEMAQQSQSLPYSSRVWGGFVHEHGGIA